MKPYKLINASDYTLDQLLKVVLSDALKVALDEEEYMTAYHINNAIKELKNE